MKSKNNNTLIALGCLFSLALSGCGSVPTLVEEEIPPKRPVSEYVHDDVHYVIDVYDPWEGMNRRIYNFNAQFDEYVFLPVVNAYEYITPDFIEDGISNFFNNLGELKNFTNSVLQLKAGKAGITLGRFAINTTVGVLGVWDPARLMGINRQFEDFGQTLGFYGVGNGPYIVLPLLGPSTLRDTAGFAVDSTVYSIATGQVIDELDLNDNEETMVNIGHGLLSGIDKRHSMNFRYYESGSPFEYSLIRLVYLEGRQILVDN